MFDLSIPAFGVSSPFQSARMNPGTPPIILSDSWMTSSQSSGWASYCRAISTALPLGFTESSWTTLPSEMAMNLLEMTSTSPSTTWSPTSPTMRPGRSNAELFLDVLKGVNVSTDSRPPRL